MVSRLLRSDGILEVADPWDPETTFCTLAYHFDLPDCLVDHLLAVKGIISLMDFNSRAVDEAEVETQLFDGVEGLPEDDREAALANLTSAWQAVRTGRVKGPGESPAESLEDALQRATLADLKLIFWDRYKTTWPSFFWPSDELILRIYDQLCGCPCSVIPLASVRTSEHQRPGQPRRVDYDRYGNALPPARHENRPPEDVETYLDRLLTLCIAYAVAGASATVNETILPPECMTSDSSDYVIIPLDLMFRYYTRAATLASSLPTTSRLDRVKELDQRERSAWAISHRHSTLSMGKTILNVFNLRDAQWSPSYNAATALEQLPQRRSFGYSDPHARDLQRPAPSSSSGTFRRSSSERPHQPWRNDRWWGADPLVIPSGQSGGSRSSFSATPARGMVRDYRLDEGTAVVISSNSN